MVARTRGVRFRVGPNGYEPDDGEENMANQAVNDVACWLGFTENEEGEHAEYLKTLPIERAAIFKRARAGRTK